MDWLLARFVVAAADAEHIGDALLAVGALSVDAADADAGTSSEMPIFAEPGADSGLWRSTAVSALFPGDADALAIASRACDEAGVMPGPIQLERVPEQDWVRLTQNQFDPIRVSPRLWVVPSWHAMPDPAAICLRLDPGLAFGTGSHPTTRLCLRWLDDHLHPGESALDYGCGSGILAIAAKLLGAGDVCGVDVDPQAVSASRDNAVRNQVRATFTMPDDLSERSFDLVIANILANPLRVLAPLICARCRPGGRIVLSGILGNQAQSVRDAYSPWVDFGPELAEESWICLWGRRRDSR